MYSYDKFTVEENQGKLWLPWNYISAELYYNQRVILSMPIDEPLTWQISKIENTIPRGIQYVTLYQDRFNQHTDKTWYPTDEDNPLPGQYTMLADYYKLPESPTIEDKPLTPSDISMELTCGSTRMYVGGSKLFTAICKEDDVDVNDDMTFEWSYFVDGVDAASLIKETAQQENNKMKITFTGDEEYANKTLVVKCVATDNNDNSVEFCNGRC